MNKDTLPLTTDPVVWKIAEHTVKTIAPKETTVSYQVAVDLYPRTVMEIKLGMRECQRSTLIDDNTLLEDNRSAFVNQHILTDHQCFFIKDSLPTICNESQGLLLTIFQ